MPLYLKSPGDASHDEEATSGDIPGFDERGSLPEGIHDADWPEVVAQFGWNEHRLRLMDGLLEACRILRLAGVDTLYLNGSFVADKDEPADYDACWDMDADNVDFSLLPSYMLPGRLHPPMQKARFRGEFYSLQYLNKYQYAGSDPKPKGVVALNLATVPHDHQD